MPNLNYDVPEDVPQNVPQDKLNCQIMDLIRKDSKVSTEKMAIAIGVSSKTIKRHIKEMDNVSYIGRGFSGHGEIADDKKLWTSRSRLGKDFRKNEIRKRKRQK